MRQKDSTAREINRKLSSYIPSFQDIFDEESFYVCVFCIVIGAVVAAVMASRYVKLKDADHMN